MNIGIFGLKRAYYSTLQVPRKPLASIDMTSARHHLMYAVRRFPGILQKQLRVVLGVARATLSKMLKRLEQLGFVTREKPKEDRRQRIVRFTERGGWAVDESYAVISRDAKEDYESPLIMWPPGPDGLWLQRYYDDVTIGYCDEDSDRFDDELGLSLGPYQRWCLEEDDDFDVSPREATAEA
jgi:DNA-binding MarR family transcriptional regulator